MLEPIRSKSKHDERVFVIAHIPHELRRLLLSLKFASRNDYQRLQIEVLHAFTLFAKELGVDFESVCAKEIKQLHTVIMTIGFTQSLTPSSQCGPRDIAVLHYIGECIIGRILAAFLTSSGVQATFYNSTYSIHAAETEDRNDINHFLKASCNVSPSKQFRNDVDLMTKAHGDEDVVFVTQGSLVRDRDGEKVRLAFPDMLASYIAVLLGVSCLLLTTIAPLSLSLSLSLSVSVFFFVPVSFHLAQSHSLALPRTLYFSLPSLTPSLSHSQLPFLFPIQTG